MVGSIRKANVNEPAMTDRPRFKKITKNPRPKRPNTTDGTPAILTIDNLIILVNLFFLAYSCKYTAEKIPIGSENTRVPKTRYSVPIITVDIPPSFIPPDGGCVRKSQVSALLPFTIMYIIMPRTKTITIRDTRSNIVWNTLCMILFLFILPLIFMIIF